MYSDDLTRQQLNKCFTKVTCIKEPCAPTLDMECVRNIQKQLGSRIAPTKTLWERINEPRQLSILTIILIPVVSITVTAVIKYFTNPKEFWKD